MIKKLMVAAGAGLAALLYRAFMRFGVPAFVEKIATDPRLPLKVKLEIHDMVPLAVQLAEVAGKYHDWPGEKKTLDVLRRIREEVGRQLTEEELTEARHEIDNAVLKLNLKYGTMAPRVSFADFVAKVKAGEEGERG